MGKIAYVIGFVEYFETSIDDISRYTYELWLLDHCQSLVPTTLGTCGYSIWYDTNREHSYVWLGKP